MNCCITGLQWGDEGKGKVVDIIAGNSDVVVRYGGGANAGHTVVIGDTRFALHLLPSGSVRPNVICVIGNGVVVDPECLIKEIDTLAQKNITLNGRFFISENAHVVLDYHKKEDQFREDSLGNNKIGTTIRGIGPCYADKIGRSYAVRMADFGDLKELKSKLQTIVNHKNKIFSALYNAEPMNADAIFEKCRVYAGRLGGFITDTTELLHKSIAEGKSILFEGAQGALLDIDHGTFPFVTSSNSSSLGMSAGCGVPARMVDKFIGVVKAYSTRVGAGPFPTEQNNDIGQYIRDRGNEYGTTTGRPRRCGWFDAVATRFAAMVNGIDELAVTNLDGLDTLDQIRVCVAYKADGKTYKVLPNDPDVLARCKPVYEECEGWNMDLSAAKSWDDLPKKAQSYLRKIAALTGAKLGMVSVGPRREQTICVG